MVDETKTNNCKASTPLSPSSFLSHGHDRKYQSKVLSRDDPNTPSSLAADDFDFEEPTSSPLSHIPSLGASFADDTKGGGYEAEIRRAVDLIGRHHRCQLGQLKDQEDLECCRIDLDPEAYSQLKEILRNDCLLTHFENDLRHDYCPQRQCLKLRLMVTPFHETFNVRFIDEIKSQLSRIASRLDTERASRDNARTAALEQTVRVIRELQDAKHATVKLAGGGTACPDGQFRHKSRIPHFVFEVGYSEEAASLRTCAEDYINGTYDVKTVVTVNSAYTREKKRKRLLRRHRRRAQDQTTVDEGASGMCCVEQVCRSQANHSAERALPAVAHGQELEQDDDQGSRSHSESESHGESKSHDTESHDEAESHADRDPDREDKLPNRCATLCLYRDTRTLVKDAMIRDPRGVAQDGSLILRLDDFISDDTVKLLEDLADQEPGLPPIHPSALTITISFRQLTAMLEKADEVQDIDDITPSPEPKPRPKRKLCLDVEDGGADDDVSTATGVKRRRVMAIGSRPRTRSMGHEA